MDPEAKSKAWMKFGEYELWKGSGESKSVVGIHCENIDTRRKFFFGQNTKLTSRWSFPEIPLSESGCVGSCSSGVLLHFCGVTEAATNCGFGVAAAVAVAAGVAATTGDAAAAIVGGSFTLGFVDNTVGTAVSTLNALLIIFDPFSLEGIVFNLTIGTTVPFNLTQLKLFIAVIFCRGCNRQVRFTIGIVLILSLVMVANCCTNMLSGGFGVFVCKYVRFGGKLTAVNVTVGLKFAM